MDLFDILEKIVDKHQIDSTSMSNVDESGFTTVQKKNPKGNITKGEKTSWHDYKWRAGN